MKFPTKRKKSCDIKETNEHGGRGGEMFQNITPVSSIANLLTGHQNFSVSFNSMNNKTVGTRMYSSRLRWLPLANSTYPPSPHTHTPTPRQKHVKTLPSPNFVCRQYLFNTEKWEGTPFRQELGELYFILFIPKVICRVWYLDSRSCSSSVP